MRILKRIICLVTAMVIFTFSVVTIPTSAEITCEQEMLNYCISSYHFEQGIPYLPSFFQNLYGWSYYSNDWDEFVSNSIYNNRIYLTAISDSTIVLYIYNYDEIFELSSSSVYFTNLVYCVLTATYDSSIDNYKVKLVQSVSESSGKNFSLANYDIKYVSISCSNQTLFLDDTTLLYESLNENKDKGIGEGIKKILTGGFSLMDNSLIDVNASDFLKLGSLFNADLTANLGVDVEVGDDTYNEIITDLTNNTNNSNYWSQIDTSTQNSIRNTYNNLRNSFDNSVKVYNNDSGDYYYMPSTTSSNDNYPNYSTYVSSGGDTTNYYQTYIYDNIGNDCDVTTVLSGNGSSSGGAYAEANAKGRQCLNW